MVRLQRSEIEAVIRHPDVASLPGLDDPHVIRQCLADLTLLERDTWYPHAADGSVRNMSSAWDALAAHVERLATFWGTDRTSATVAVHPALGYYSVAFPPRAPGLIATHRPLGRLDVHPMRRSPFLVVVLGLKAVVPAGHPQPEAPHLCLLVLDRHRRTGSLYDPNGNSRFPERPAGSCWSDAVSRLTGAGSLPFADAAGPYALRCEPRRYFGVSRLLNERLAKEEPDYRDPLGFALTRNRAVRDPVQNGNCSVAVNIVLACALRLQCPDLWAIDTAIVRYMQRIGGAEREQFRRNALRWVKRLMRVRRWDEMEDAFGLTDPIDDVDRRCAVLSRHTKRPCQRRPCAGHAFCWQHRHALIVAPGSAAATTSRRCSSPVGWDARPAPRGPWCANPQCTQLTYH